MRINMKIVSSILSVLLAILTLNLGDLISVLPTWTYFLFYLLLTSFMIRTIVRGIENRRLNDYEIVFTIEEANIIGVIFSGGLFLLSLFIAFRVKHLLAYLFVAFSLIMLVAIIYEANGPYGIKNGQVRTSSTKFDLNAVDKFYPKADGYIIEHFKRLGPLKLVYPVKVSISREDKERFIELLDGYVRRQHG